MPIAQVIPETADTYCMRLRIPHVVAAAVAAVALLVPASALAADVGEPVDYDLVLPVDGEHHFADTLASRTDRPAPEQAAVF